MRQILTLLLFFALVLSSCSSDDAPSNSGNGSTYFKLKINGTDFAPQLNKYSVILQGNIFTVVINNDQINGDFTLRFDKRENGKLLDIEVELHDERFGIAGYKNYINYPSNYFDVNLISLDENSNTVKASFSGKLYYRNGDLNSEAIDVAGEFSADYEDGGGPQIMYDIHCTAKFNGNPWEAVFTNFQSNWGPRMTFTTYDPYKIDIRFAPNNNQTGTFDVTPTSAENYIKLAKFNTTTLTYDYYDVSGNLDYYYKEFHGATNYTYFGSFNFTAVNPNNPADVIEVIDGQFISGHSY